MQKKIRAVLVGCGGMSGGWLDTVARMKDVETVGLVDLKKNAARKRQKEYELSDAVVGADLREVLRKTKPDMVYNCTVPEAHSPVALEAFRHGCHVLCEKPMASGMAEARKMNNAAQRSGTILAVTQNRRYTKYVRSVAEFIASGVIGKVSVVNMDFYAAPHFTGFRKGMEHPLLVDMAIHAFDMARFISSSDPSSVYCSEWNPAWSWYDHDACAAAIFEMTSDVVVNYRGSWCANGFDTTWQCEWRIIGEKGTIRWNGESEIKCERTSGKPVGNRVQKHAPVKAVRVPISAAAKSKGGSHSSVIKEFIQCLRSGQKPETCGEDNIKSLAMVFGAIRSSKSGRNVSIRD